MTMMMDDDDELTEDQERSLDSMGTIEQWESWLSLPSVSDLRIVYEMANIDRQYTEDPDPRHSYNLRELMKHKHGIYVYKDRLAAIYGVLEEGLVRRGYYVQA